MGSNEITGSEQPLVSVIMPCYNDGETLPQTIECLKKQNYPKIELIVIDDGSDDNSTPEVIRDLRYPEVTVLHTNHQGPAHARNEGIRKARGKYILPLDADDLIEPEYIRRAVHILEENPSVGIVYCHADLFGENGGPWELPDYSLKAMLVDNCIFVTSMFRKKDWEAAGGFCEEFKAGMEDYDFWLSLLERGLEVHQFSEVYFHYRIKPFSRTSAFQKSYQDVQETYVKLYERHKEFFRQHMDDYCLQLRWHLIDQLWSKRTDPLVNYILVLREKKPRLADFFEKLLRKKQKLNQLIGR